jgi:hypothetical protein
MRGISNLRNLGDTNWATNKFVPKNYWNKQTKWQQDSPYESTTYSVCSNVPVILGRMGETWQITEVKTFAQPVQKESPDRVSTPKITGTLEHT